MANIDASVRRLADLVEGRITSKAVPHLFEAVCAWRSETVCRNFVLGAEGATFDAGLIIADDCELPQDMTERLFYALEHLRNRHVVLPIDIKTIYARPGPRWRGPTIRYRLEFRKSQGDCGLVIITNSSRPDLVIVVPRAMIQGDSNHRHYEWEAEYNTGQEPQPFPIALTPLVMPMEFLPQALQAGVDWCRDPKAGWRNPSNDITFPNIAPAILKTPSTLIACEESHLNDLESERFLHKALQDHSQQYRLQRHYIKPCISDFALVHNTTGVIANVEMKEGMVRVRDSLKLGPDTLIHGSSRNFYGLPGRFFSPFRQWDFLLTISVESHESWLLPIDAIPENWFTDDATNSKTHKWRAGVDFLDQHRVRWDPDHAQGVAEDVERVLNRYLNTQQGLSRADIRQWNPMILINHPYLIDQALGSDASSYQARDWQYKRHQQRGTQDMWTPRLSESRWTWRIRQQCISESFGAFYPLGKRHPAAEFAFAFGVWDEPPPFVCLPEDTQIVFVNFAFVAAGDARTVTDSRRPEQFLLATEGTYPSIYIIVPYEEEDEGNRLNVHVVPTTLMKSDPKRKKINHTVNNSERRWKALNSKNCMPVHLAPGHHVEGFLAGEHSLVRVFKRLLQKFAGIPDEESESVLDIAGVASLDPGSLITTKQVALQQTVSTFFKRRSSGSSKKIDGKGQGDESGDNDQGNAIDGDQDDENVND